MYLFPHVLHGLCEYYLTCDIAFNAVMSLSRASTRGRYSRIEGVTSWYQSQSSDTNFCPKDDKALQRLKFLQSFVVDAWVADAVFSGGAMDFP